MFPVPTQSVGKLGKEIKIQYIRRQIKRNYQNAPKHQNTPKCQKRQKAPKCQNAPKGPNAPKR